jgi:hypothetical protein
VSLLQRRVDLLGNTEIVGAQRGDISVLQIPKKQADALIKAGHYSGTVVWSSNTHLGVYHRDDLIGAMQFGPAMNPRSGHKIVEGSTPATWLELNRLWLRDDKPANTASQAIACAFQIIRNVRPQVEWIQSFADERCSKLGAVYQACSFDYVGYHESKFFKIDDVWIHNSMLTRKQVDKRGWKQGPRVKWAQENAHRAVPYTFKQYRYVKFLQPGARRRLLKPPLPYPKPPHLVTCDMDADCLCVEMVA